MKELPAITCPYIVTGQKREKKGALWRDLQDKVREINHTTTELRTKEKAAVIQYRLFFGGLGIPERIGSNTDYGLSGNWASTRGNGPLVGWL